MNFNRSIVPIHLSALSADILKKKNNGNDTAFYQNVFKIISNAIV